MRFCFFTYIIATFAIVAHAAQEIDSLFAEAATRGALVMQANFVEDGTPSLKARLWGMADGEFKIVFTSSSDKVTLDGQRLNAGGVTDVIKPDDFGRREWRWAGTFSCSDPTASIDIMLPSRREPITAFLGDVWVIAGGANVAAESLISVPNGASFSTMSLAEGGGVIACVPVAAPSEHATNAPTLAWSFAMGLVTNLGRPVAIYTISSPQARHNRWLPTSSVWKPLYGNQESEHRVSLGTRGIVWWTGEWDAEYGSFPAPMPPALSENEIDWAHELSTWKDAQAKAIEYNINEFCAMTAGAAKPNEKQLAQVNQLNILIQLQSVNRQPPHFNLFRFERDPASAWELYRAAQSDAVASLRRSTSKAVRPRAVLVPAISGGGLSFPTAWFWDNQDDLASFAQELVRVAVLYLGPKDSSSLKIGPPSVVWDDPKNVTLEFTGDPKGLPAASTSDEFSSLEVSTKQDLSIWTKVTEPWSSRMTISSADSPIIAVRYGAGDSPKPLLPIHNVKDEPAGVIPTFEFIRP